MYEALKCEVDRVRTIVVMDKTSPYQIREGDEGIGYFNLKLFSNFSKDNT